VTGFSSQAKDQWILGERLDEMVLMILDRGIRNNTEKILTIAGTTIFLN